MLRTACSLTLASVYAPGNCSTSPFAVLKESSQALNSFCLAFLVSSKNPSVLGRSSVGTSFGSVGVE